MRLIPLTIVLTSLVFFSLFMGGARFPARHASPLNRLLPGLPTSSTPGAILWRSLVTGDDLGLSPADKRSYFRLGLGHLFTPSGVHLATLQPLIKLLPYQPLFYGLVALLGAQVAGLAALARVALVKTLRGAQDHWPLFASLLLLEGALVSWQRQPLSWTCSWLFLGLCWFAPARQRPLWFMLASLLVAWVFRQPFSLFSPLANLLAALPLALLFPCALLLAPLPVFFAHHAVEAALGGFHRAVLAFDGIHQWVPALMPHAGHVILALLWVSLLGKARRWLPLSLLLLAQPLNQSKLKAYSLSRFEVVPAPEARLMGVAGLTARWSDGVKCRARWLGDGWEENCRPPGRRAAKKKKLRKLSWRR